MFEKYTDKAKRVIFFARYEASQFGSPAIETEHLLLGLIREEGAIAERMGTTTEEIRKDIKSQTPIRTKIPESEDLPFSDESKTALNKAAAESERLSSGHIGTEHILLGLLAANGSRAAQILQEHGIRPES